MIFQIVQPFVADIYGDSFKEAVKNYVKFNHNLNITNMIIKDQSDHYETRIRYYTENNKNKVGIDVYPYTNVSYPLITPVIAAPAPIVRSNVPITIAPSVVPIAPISTTPMVTVKGSPYIANNNNVLVRNPIFY
jgi:hypothetical protein